MVWNGGLWVDTNREGHSEPQYEIKQNMERIADIDIENLEFLLKMIKNMSFDVAGGNFINLNGSILRDGKLHYPKSRTNREWNDGAGDFTETTELIPEPQSSTPLDLDEVFIKTDWGFVYCGIVDITQFMFIQGGLHWLWSQTNHDSTMQGWERPQKPQLTVLMIGRAVDTEWYQSQRDFAVRAYGRGTYSDGEPTIHYSKYAQTRQSHMFTSGLTTQNVVDFVEGLPSFDEFILEEYGDKKAYNQAIEKKMEESRYGGSKKDFQERTWGDYEEQISRKNTKSDISIPNFIENNYGLVSEKAFYLGRNGNITMAENQTEIHERVQPHSGKGSRNRITPAIAWNENHRTGFRTGKQPKIIKDWRTKAIDPSRTTVTHFNEDEDENETNFLYSADDIANSGISFYQYKMSQRILNRMVL